MEVIMREINILAVNDPAVKAYTNRQDKLAERIGKTLDITVNIEVVEFADYYGRLMEAFKDSLYDIVMVAGHLWLPAFVEKGYLAPIEFDNNDTYDYEDVIATIRSEMSVKGQQYLLPSFCDGHMVLYKKEKMKFKDKHPTTIQEITKALEKYAAKPFKPFVLKAHESELFLDFLPYLRSFGVEPFAEDGTPQFNQEDGIRALKRYKYMVEFAGEDSLEYGNVEVMKRLQQDLCYVGLTWGGQLGAVMGEGCMNPDSWSFSYPETPWNVTWSFGINHNSLQQALATQVLMELTSKAVDLKVGRICGNPTRESSFEADRRKYPWYPAVKEMFSQSKPLASFSKLPDAIGVVTGELRQAILGVKSPEEALQHAEEKVNSLLR
jgi:multiple sugar transport system substrate-binding protein